ncbi:hypothetical protein LJC25_04070 [Bacteroidales bacterium OttesenSCG-928-K03]|nr:hypothetical protein [Bacteroidales bacterium OttesenSCG-928-K03]
MKNLFLLIVFGVIAINCTCQIVTIYQPNHGEPIEVLQVKQNKFIYLQDDVQLNYNQILNIVQNDSEATKYLKKAKNQIGAASVLGYCAGFCLGYGIVGLLFNPSEANLIIAGAGLGFLAIGLPLEIPFRKNVYKGVSIYNENLGGINEVADISLRFGFTNNGVGMVLNF